MKHAMESFQATSKSFWDSCWDFISHIAMIPLKVHFHFIHSGNSVLKSEWLSQKLVVQAGMNTTC